MILSQQGAIGFDLRWYQISGTALTALDQTNLEFWAASPHTKRGALAFRHFYSTGAAGRLYFSYIPTAPYDDEARVQITEGDGTAAPLRFFAASRLDNRWHNTTAGVALLGWHSYAAGNTAEQNLRWAGLFNKSTSTLLDFRPFGDDIVNIQLKDHNDWQRIGDNMCVGIHLGSNTLCQAPGDNTVGATVPGEVTCIPL